MCFYFRCSEILASGEISELSFHGQRGVINPSTDGSNDEIWYQTLRLRSTAQFGFLYMQSMYYVMHWVVTSFGDLLYSWRRDGFLLLYLLFKICTASACLSVWWGTALPYQCTRLSFHKLICGSMILSIQSFPDSLSFELLTLNWRFWFIRPVQDWCLH